MDPYAELGVPREADAEAVKHAYRRKAQRAHPDKGGTPAKFQVLQAAYDVLSDPERRRRYDETGAADAASDPIAAATSAIARMVIEFAEKVPDVEHTDILAMMRGAVNQQIGMIRKRRAEVERSIARQERVLERFTRKAVGEDVVGRVLRGAIEQSRAGLARLDEAVVAHEAILEVLADYEYRVDEVAWPGGMQSQAATMGSIFSAMHNMGGTR